ncbi:MAG: energy transducer TonB [Bacteroidota bacterium]|nr:energy transducer TonB [Bacteroidota bacterium]
MKNFNFKHLPASLLLCFLCFATNSSAQAGKALELFNQGNKAHSKKKYRAADSLFTLSINLKATSQAYVNRAATRKKLNDNKGYCMDLWTATNMFNKEATVLFSEDCSKTDTLYKDANQKITDNSNYVFKEAISSCELIGSYDYIKYNTKNEIVLSYYKMGKDTIYRQGSEMTMPEFPGGGFNAMRTFINGNMNYPTYARENGLSGKVWVSFMVSKTGKIENAVVAYGMKDCDECNAEALRVVSLMPQWIPGKYKGKNVQSSFRAPFTFKIK